MEYEELLVEAESQGIVVKEKHLLGSSGRIKGNKIAIKDDIPTVKKICALSEELGHYYTTVGNILNQDSTSSVKQELRARNWSYDQLVGLTGIIRAFEHRCTNIYDIAEYLNVDIEFLTNAIKHYSAKYGVCTKIDTYIIYFEPQLAVIKLF